MKDFGLSVLGEFSEFVGIDGGFAPSDERDVALCEGGLNEGFDLRRARGVIAREKENADGKVIG